MLVALAWSLFQLWIASPLPFMLGFGVFNDTEARAFHLGFAIFLGFMTFPSARTPFQMVLGIGVPLLLTWLFWIGSDGAWWVPIVGALVIAGVALGSPRDRVPRGNGRWRSRALPLRSTSILPTRGSRTASARRSRRISLSASPASCCCSRRRAARSGPL